MIKERFCWYCGESMGPIDSKYYDRTDTCGRPDCEREARLAAVEERADAHRELDDRMGWSD